MNGWRNAETWTINLHFGDHFSEGSWDAESIQAYVEEAIDYDNLNSLIVDMMDWRSIDWEELAEHAQAD